MGPGALQTLYFVSLREALMKKKSFKSKTAKFFIVYSLCSQELAFSSLSLSNLSLGSEPNLSSLYRGFIYNPLVLPQLRCF